MRIRWVDHDGPSPWMDCIRHELLDGYLRIIHSERDQEYEWSSSVSCSRVTTVESIPTHETLVPMHVIRRIEIEEGDA